MTVALDVVAALVRAGKEGIIGAGDEFGLTWAVACATLAVSVAPGGPVRCCARGMSIRAVFWWFCAGGKG